jgi:hypothetical protein
MAFTFRKNKVSEAESPEQSGGWYADPYGAGARRWFDTISGWSKRVQGAGQAPDETGLARMDEAAATPDGSPRPVDADGTPVPLSRPVDPKYMADARPVR